MCRYYCCVLFTQTFLITQEVRKAEYELSALGVARYHFRLMTLARFLHVWRHLTMFGNLRRGKLSVVLCRAQERSERLALGNTFSHLQDLIRHGYSSSDIGAMSTACFSSDDSNSTMEIMASMQAASFSDSSGGIESDQLSHKPRRGEGQDSKKHIVDKNNVLLNVSLEATGKLTDLPLYVLSEESL
jgi:hypothetical protein